MNSLYVKGTFTGSYKPRGNVLDADCIIGCEFAHPSPEGQFWGIANEDLAAFIRGIRIMRRVPLLLNPQIARPLERKFGGPPPALAFRGKASALTSIEQGTKGELMQAKEYMEAHNLHRPVLVAQAHHIGRAALQAEYLYGTDSTSGLTRPV